MILALLARKHRTASRWLKGRVNIQRQGPRNMAPPLAEATFPSGAPSCSPDKTWAALRVEQIRKADAVL